MKTLFAALLLIACCGCQPTPKGPREAQPPPSEGPREGHDIGETLPHFLAYEHMSMDKKTCFPADAFKTPPPKEQCEIRLWNTSDRKFHSFNDGIQGDYRFLSGVLVEIDVNTMGTSFETAVQDITVRYGKKPGAIKPCFEQWNESTWFVQQAAWRLPGIWIDVYRPSGEILFSRIIIVSETEAHRLRGDNVHVQTF